MIPGGHGRAHVGGFLHPRRARFTPAAIVPPDEMPGADHPVALTTGRQLEH